MSNTMDANVENIDGSWRMVVDLSDALVESRGGGELGALIASDEFVTNALIGQCLGTQVQVDEDNDGNVTIVALDGRIVALGNGLKAATTGLVYALIHHAASSMAPGRLMVIESVSGVVRTSIRKEVKRGVENGA